VIHHYDRYMNYLNQVTGAFGDPFLARQQPLSPPVSAECNKIALGELR